LILANNLLKAIGPMGPPNDTAVNQVQAFIKQVQALMNSNNLTPDEGQALIDAANAVVAQIEGGG